MASMNRRWALRAVGAGAVATGFTNTEVFADGEPTLPQLWPLEGELRVLIKPNLYLYCLVITGGATIALYGADHGVASNKLAGVRLPARVRVRGKLGTAFHPGGTENNPSPVPPTWLVYMDVQEVEPIE